mmetsp:Transcript_19502/g.30962  ORF Transcript_19502/g.30962 Transcript_19502/m.30962 type:complete len:589 (-) Transcript_19502:169-1935(-)|eukprot:jgi/Bigna1/126858/aug1.3_g1566
MSLLYFSKTRLRKDFGMPVTFSDGTSRVLHSVNSDANPESEQATQWVKKRYSTIEIDCTPNYAQHTADTGNFVQKPEGALFVHGAWPKKIKGGEITERQRYLQRLTAEPSYFQEVPKICESAQASVAQNNTLNLYEQYFADDDIYETEDATMRMDTKCVLKDPCELKRHATKLCWHPDGSGKIAVSYSIMKFQQMTDVTPMQSYIWDINHPNEPEFELIPQSPLTCIQFNPKTHDHVAGGMYNGVIGFWDTRKQSPRPIANSNIKYSHRDPVFDVRYVSSRSGTECVSVSTDGQLLWWDTRNLEKPIDEFTVMTEDKEILGISSLEYKTEGGPTKYLVGTEKGFPVLIDRKAKKDQASEKKIKAIFNQGHGGHYTSARAIKRNPVHTSFYLTVGDWCTKIWSEENLKSPIMITRHNKPYLTSACWSTIRPGVFFTGKANGIVDVWDIYSKQNEPVLHTKISDTPITDIAIHKAGGMMAIGAEDGVTSIVTLGKGLSTLQRMEKEVVLEIFEREKKRESLIDKMRILERKKRERELKMKAKGPKPAKDLDKETEAREKAIKRADEHWAKMIESFRVKEEEKNQKAAADS